MRRKNKRNCGYSVLISGPAGAGKTVFAHGTPTILPNMVIEEMLEVTGI